MTAARRKDVEVPSTKRPSPDQDPVLGELLGVKPSLEPAAQTTQGQPAARPRMTVYISEDVQASLRAAVYWTRNEQDGFENLSDLLEAAAQAAIRELEGRYNQGNPFPAIPEGKGLRRGRPIGS